MHTYEYNTIPVGRNVNNGVGLSEKQAYELEQISLELKRKKIIGKSFYRWVGRDSLKFMNYAGIVSLGSEQLEILPKIFKPRAENSSDYEKSFIAFARLISYIFKTKIFDEDLIKIRQTEKLGILDIIIFFYISSLKAAIKNGIYNKYEPEIFDSRFIRGKICFDKLLNRPPGSTLLQGSYLFTSDNDLMKYLKTATLYFAKLSRSNSLRTRLHKLSSLFSDIGTLDLSTLGKKIFKFNRLNRAYEDAYNLSKLILSGLLIQPNADKSLFGVVFLLDMNKVFEDFVAVFIERNWNILSRQTSLTKVIKQNSGKHLFIDRNIRPLIPDVRLLNTSNVTEIIFDTKYKIGPEFENDRKDVSKVSKGDLYQMYAYSAKYNAKETVLIYPTLSNTSELDALKFEEKQMFRIWDINLSLWEDDWESNLIESFTELMHNVTNL